MDLQDNTSTFLQVIENNKGIIYKIANAYCKDEEERKDLVQETIIQLWQSFPRYDKAYKLSTWMYRIALNVAISSYRKDSRRKAIALPFSENILQLAEKTPSDDAEKELLLLQQFIAGLKELDRALMILYLEEKTHKEMAEILGLSETNIATKIGRIKEKLKQKFSTINRS